MNFQCGQPCLSDGKRLLLDTKFSDDKVRVALLDMFPMKAPGPYGLAVLFYHKFWSVVRE